MGSSVMDICLLSGIGSISKHQRHAEFALSIRSAQASNIKDNEFNHSSNKFLT